jgi:hypothetical protein
MILIANCMTAFPVAHLGVSLIPPTLTVEARNGLAAIRVVSHKSITLFPSPLIIRVDAGVTYDDGQLHRVHLLKRNFKLPPQGKTGERR